MRKGNRIYGIIAVLLLSLGACSLIHDDMEELGYREDGSAYAYVSLTIHTGTAGNVTRANPTGGEDGNGNEKGQDYENRVNNLTLFFYPATLGDGGVNRNGDIEFTAKVYITNPDPNWAVSDGTQPIDKTFTVGPVKVNGLKMNQQYHVLAVANAGDLADPKKEIVRLDDLRKAEINQVYAFSEQKGYSNFVMASEGDENPVLDIKYDNSKDNPAETTINLERLVARVDYKTNDKNEYQLSSSLITPGLNPAQTTVKATITRAFLVNTYKQDTYVLKRVAEGNTTGTITYLGDESLSNYVIDPKTTSKTIPVPEDKNIPSWYDHYFPNLNDGNSEEWENWLIQGDPITEPGTTDTWLRLGYPKENTSSKDAQGKYYSTGVVFEAEYNLGTGFTTGKTFFLVNGTTLFATLEEAMKAHNASFDENRRFSSSADPYAELQAYMGVLEDNDPAGYKAFLQTAKKTDTDWTVYEWASYKTNQLGYDSDGNPTAATRKALHDRVTEPYKTETFLNGRGYYTYWIRHNYGDKDNVVSGLPMENAIVRNNIYKLTVRSIKEIGNDVPGDKTLDILVAVAKWKLLDEENIELQPTN